MSSLHGNGTAFSDHTAHATSAVASEAAATGVTHYITSIAGSSDLATATLTVHDGATIIWQVEIGAGSFQQDFGADAPLVCTSGNLASVTVTATAGAEANIAGYSLGITN